MSKQAHKPATERMADLITGLVNRKNGPVLLSEIEQTVPGFRAAQAPSWSYFIHNDGNECTIWDGLSDVGYRALREVLNSRRVAVEYVSKKHYFIAGGSVDSDDWVPIALVPKRMANLDTPIWAVRVEPWVQQQAISHPSGKYRSLNTAASATWQRTARKAA